MNCSNIRRKIVQYADGGLPPCEEVDFELHIKQCPSCRQEVEAFKNLNRLIDSADLEIPHMRISPGDITKGVIRNIQAEGSKRLAPLIKDTLTAAAAAMIIFWFSGSLINNVEVPQYSREIVKVSNTVGGIFKSYMMFSTGISDKLSNSINNVTPNMRKGR